MNGTDFWTAYRETKSDEAFAELVRRYTALVYSVAARRLSNSAAVEEVVQLVFIRLAQAAPRFKHDAQLVAWLHRTTVHVAIDAWRMESRRRTRELLASAMEPASTDDHQLWEEIAPKLDEALDRLNEADREAVLLRFFERKPMREVGGILGVSEDAAKMRVARAVERLRAQLAPKGAACSVAAFSIALTARSVETAPAALLSGLTSVRFLHACSRSAAAASSNILPMVILMSKAKLMTALVAIALVGSGIFAIKRHIDQRNRPTEQRIAGTGKAGDAPATLESSKALAQPSPNNRGSESSGINAASDLEDAKRELRALLNRPPAARSGYPPLELRRVLLKFGDEPGEAMTILLEAIAARDYETRIWSTSGIRLLLGQARQKPETSAIARELFVRARPALTQIMRSSDESDTLRGIALSAYLPFPSYMNGRVAESPPPLTSESAEDLLAILRANEKGSHSFRFTLVDHLSGYFQTHPAEAESFAAAIQPILDDSQPSQRLLAAYALASWPGEKPPGVKRELVGELEAQATVHSYRAAAGLGKMGAASADAVPALLAYAEATKEWSAGYRQQALEAVCRIQPELRAQYPAIDAKLKEETEIAQSGGFSTTRISTPSEAAKSVRVSDQEGNNFVLPAELGRRVGINLDPSDTERPTLLMRNLVFDARILLQEEKRRSQKALETLLNDFQTRYAAGASEASVTGERFQELAKRLEEVDADFQNAWRKQVLKNYPWLDRVLLNEE